MRKLLLMGLIAATIFPGVANAQSRGDIREDRRELRQDRRELNRDKREWRNDHRVAYVAPYRDFRYRPVVTGFQLRPGFYGGRYVVTDWNRYRVAAPRLNQRWIRYGNDLVLVNTRNGRVLQVLQNRY